MQSLNHIATPTSMGPDPNAGWIDNNQMDGLRRSLAKEFASIHVFHLRGDARTSGELRRKEKDNVFGMGTRTPIAISILVKNPRADKQGLIRYHDIGNYLARDEKLAIIARFGSIGGIGQSENWQTLTPDEHGDWLGQRDKAFEAFFPMGSKKNKGEVALFTSYSSGVKSQ